MTVHPRIVWRAVALCLLLTGSVAWVAPPGTAAPAGGAVGRSDPAFQRVWLRTDGVVAARQAERPWVWGPAAFFAGRERWGAGTRPVQYYPKGRMEITSPDLPPDSPGYVTNGRLVVELVSGELAVGEEERQLGAPAQIPVVGEPSANPNAPTYASFRFVASIADDRRVPPRVGQPIIETMARDGVIGQNPDLGAAVTVAAYSEETGHNLPDVFVDYLNSRGPVSDGFRVAESTLLDAPLTVGYPITEAYWTQVVVDGRSRDVLIQLFERRTLLYWPDRPAGYRVELGDVGRHYFDWRYRGAVAGGQAARYKDLSLVVTGVTRSSVEAGPAPAATPATSEPASPTPAARRRKGAPTPTPAPPTATPLPPGALTTSGVFVIAELAVTNAGLTATTLGVGDFILVDREGRQYEVSQEATALAAQRLRRTPASATIRPGFTLPLVRVWEVPADARGLMMVPAYGEKPALAVE